MKYIIYLLSFNQPKQATVFVVQGDSVFFYHDKYYKERIVYQKPDLYVFNGGFAAVKSNKILIEHDRELVRYKIKNAYGRPQH